MLSGRQKKSTLVHTGIEELAGRYGALRIPGVVVSGSGTVLVYFEARSSRMDWAEIDILLMRSEDSGASFSPVQLLADGLSHKATVNNPVMIAGSDGTLHFIYCIEYAVPERSGDVMYRKSTDDGRSWSSPVSIAAATSPHLRTVFAVGPGHGICLNNGVLLVPAWFVPRAGAKSLTAHHPSEVCVLYSLDNGESWALSESPEHPGIADPNESAAVQLHDGTVLMNIRSEGKSRCLSRSTDGHSGWNSMLPVPELPDPVCFGSMADCAAAGEPEKTLFVNCESRKSRKNLVVKQSTNGGKSWEKIKTITRGNAGYADIGVDGAGNIYVIYETAEYDRLLLSVFRKN